MIQIEFEDFFFQLQHWEFSYKCNRIVCDIASHSNGRPHFLLRDRPHTDIRFNSTFTVIVWSKSIDLLKTLSIKSSGKLFWKLDIDYLKIIKGRIEKQDWKSLFSLKARVFRFQDFFCEKNSVEITPFPQLYSVWERAPKMLVASLSFF